MERAFISRGVLPFLFFLVSNFTFGATDLYRVGNRELGWHINQGADPEFSAQPFLEKVQPILNSRCVACHGCYEAPCQTNLQSYEALRRGYNPIWDYSGRRLIETPKTRMTYHERFDAKAIQAWREKGFLPIVTHDEDEIAAVQGEAKDASLFVRLVEAGKENTPGFDLAAREKLQKDIETEAQGCLATPRQFSQRFSRKNSWKVTNVEDFLAVHRGAGGMPFGLPKLSDAQQETLLAWAKSGAPGPSAPAQDLLSRPSRPEIIAAWESFFNTPTNRGLHTARYIYEHVYSALFSIKEIPGEFYELVRAYNNDYPIREISTELNNQNPGPMITYRLRKVSRALVQKAQIIWEVDNTKLQHLKDLFLTSSGWAEPVPRPVYDDRNPNPFKYFAPIPAAVRSRFLIENSKVIVGAMVRGSVCVGSQATYAISDHFWAWFLSPESDPSVQVPDLGLKEIDDMSIGAFKKWEPLTPIGRSVKAKIDALNLKDTRAVQLLIKEYELARSFVSEKLDHTTLAKMASDMHEKLGVPVSDAFEASYHFARTVTGNHRYQEAFEKTLRALLAKRGKANLTADDLWKGDGDPSYPNNDSPNAWLSILRHDRSATVRSGREAAKEGGVPKTAWFMSYSNFERLYYDLVLNFKEWGSVPHRIGTWRVMSYVRLEGEDLFISALPVAYRTEVRNWFSRGLGRYYNDVFFEAQSLRKDFSDPKAFIHVPLIGNVHDPRKKLPARGTGDFTYDGGNPVRSVERLVGAIEERVAGTSNKSYNNLSPTDEQKELEPSLLSLQPGREDWATVKQAFARWLPEVSFIKVNGDNGKTYAYTLIIDRGYKSHNVIIGQKPARDEQYDTVSVYRGFEGAYPNAFLEIDKKDLPDLVEQIRALNSAQSWERLLNDRRYGIARNSSRMWSFYDWVHQWKSVERAGNHVVEEAIVDLSQYHWLSSKAE